MVRFVSFIFLFVVAQNASAQQIPERRPETIRVQVSVNFVLPVPAGEDEALKVQENARRSLYVVADKECALLRETIAAECRLESINVSVNRLRAPNPETINASASMTYRLQPK